MSSTAWREAWIAWRNRLLSDVRFQQWAAGFPLTRPIATRRAQGLFDLVAGFVYSQTLAACVRLKLFESLAAGPKDLERLAAEGDLNLEAARRLMEAARALRLIDRTGPDRYALGPQGAALLGNAGLMEMIDHHGRLYGDLADSLGLLRRGRGELADYWPYATSPSPRQESAEKVAPYSALMAATQPTVSADVLDAYPVARHRRLLDVGGGEGVFLAAAGARAPKLDLMLFDLPAVTERAKIRLGAAGLLERSSIVSGDFLTDALPAGADLITLIRILHDHDDQGVSTVLEAIRRVLPPAGALLVAEPMAGGEALPDRVGDVYFAFYLLAMGRGRARSPKEISAHLLKAGFSRVRALRTRSPFILRAVLAEP
jgi:demethylspheroidene O-methyltransferase